MMKFKKQSKLNTCKLSSTINQNQFAFWFVFFLFNQSGFSNKTQGIIVWSDEITDLGEGKITSKRYGQREQRYSNTVYAIL